MNWMGLFFSFGIPIAVVIGMAIAVVRGRE